MNKIYIDTIHKKYSSCVIIVYNAANIQNTIKKNRIVNTT